MALLQRDTANNELFITPIRGLYDEYAMSIEEFKDKNAGIMKNRWVDTSHGDNGEKIYELYNPEEPGDIIKENLQEWLCDNRFEITSSISIALRNHERSYAKWFRYIEDMSGPDELALYSLSRKYGIQTAVFNKTYVWTTLMNHINVPDEEIIAKCGVNLVFLGPTKYGIIKNIRTPQPQSAKPLATGSKRAKGKVTCRNDSRGKKVVRGRGTGRGTRPSRLRTLISSRQQNYGITPSPSLRVSKRTKPQIDYLTLNDGLEEEAPASPKRGRRGKARPRREPSSRRLWAQRQMGSPKAIETLSGVPTSAAEPAPSTSTATQPSASLSGVPPSNEPRSDSNLTLTGVHINDTLQDLVSNRTGEIATTGDHELDAAHVLLSLGDSLNSTLDDADDNACLMPIGGGGSVPLDVAPQPLRLDQINVDAAIAGVVQSEEPSSVSGIVPSEKPLKEHEKENDDARETEATQDADPEDDLPLAALAETLEKPNSPVKGVLKTKMYRLKKKHSSNRTFKCPACETWKSSTQLLNAHYKRRHPPLMCGICGRPFALP